MVLKEAANKIHLAMLPKVAVSLKTTELCHPFQFGDGLNNRRQRRRNEDIFEKDFYKLSQRHY